MSQLLVVLSGGELSMMNIQRRLTFWNSSAGKSRRRSANRSRYAGSESLEKRELLAADLEVLKNIAPGSASSLPASSFSNDVVMAAEFDGWVYFRVLRGS